MRLLMSLTYTVTLWAVFGLSDAHAQALSRESLLDFVNTRYQAYFHYNMCTFKNANSDEQHGRSSGKEPATMWHPTGLDCRQWAQVCIASKMAGGWLTTKHHGGFCLWDSAYTDYDVASSRVKTDVVRVFTDTFRKAGLKIGLYYSILDYHHGVENGQVTRDEIEFTKAQITELLSHYGPIDYINFDGWATWPTVPTFDDMPYGDIYRTVKALQPECLIVNHCYESNLAHADVPFADASGRDYSFHPDYMRPTAASDALQGNWWWDDREGFGVRRSVRDILRRLDSYNAHNSVYVLNIAPNTAGRLPDDAVQHLATVAGKWKKPADLKKYGENWGYQYEVEENLAFLRHATQSSTRPFIRDKRAYPRAEIAVDGVIEGNGDMEQTSMTMEEDRPWWQVDLERDCRLDRIRIFNRTDQARGPLQNFGTLVLDKSGGVVWEHHEDSAPRGEYAVETEGVLGRVVKIQLDGHGPLSLAEVIVHGNER